MASKPDTQEITIDLNKVKNFIIPTSKPVLITVSGTKLECKQWEDWLKTFEEMKAHTDKILDKEKMKARKDKNLDTDFNQQLLDELSFAKDAYINCPNCFDYMEVKEKELINEEGSLLVECDYCESKIISSFSDDEKGKAAEERYIKILQQKFAKFEFKEIFDQNLEDRLEKTKLEFVPFKTKVGNQSMEVRLGQVKVDKMKKVGQELIDRTPNPIQIKDLYWQKEIVKLFAPNEFTYLDYCPLSDNEPEGHSGKTYKNEYGFHPRTMRNFIVDRLFKE
jgi:hypothetical protein